METRRELEAAFRGSLGDSESVGARTQAETRFSFWASGASMRVEQAAAKKVGPETAGTVAWKFLLHVHAVRRKALFEFEKDKTSDVPTKVARIIRKVLAATREFPCSERNRGAAEDMLPIVGGTSYRGKRPDLMEEEVDSEDARSTSRRRRSWRRRWRRRRRNSRRRCVGAREGSASRRLEEGRPRRASQRCSRRSCSARRRRRCRRATRASSRSARHTREGTATCVARVATR